MAQIMTLAGSAKERRSLGATDECKCVYNPRTKKSVLLCTVPRSQSRSGKAFKKDLHGLCRR
jgi:hypothetical protein